MDNGKSNELMGVLNKTKNQLRGIKEQLTGVKSQKILKKEEQEKNKALLGYSGFSLVELMIVVAIIGVLTAIAIPNFQAFQARSRQSEAKAALTSIYTAEQAFHSHWEVYAAPLDAVGYVPSGEYRYVAGFDNGLANKGKFCGLAGGGDISAAGPDLGCGPAPGRKYTGVTADANDLINVEAYCDDADTTSCEYNGLDTLNTKLEDHANVDTAVGINTFTAAAVGDPSGAGIALADAKTKGDIWQIDENKELKHVLDQLDEVQSN